MAPLASPVAVTGEDLVALLGPKLATSRRVGALTLTLREGAWDAERIPESRRSPLGVLVLSGVIVRELRVAGYESGELLGDGDVVDPWGAALPPEALLPASATWSVLVPARVLVIDEGLAAAAARSVLLDALRASVARRAARLAMSQAIAQLPRIELRLLALFWHLAERWGRVGQEGIVMPLPLSHALLGRLVGARRPTVTLALGELGARGYVRRRDDGSWQIGVSAPHAVDGHAEPAPKRRGAGTRNEPDQLDRMAAALQANLASARAQVESQVEALPDQLARLAELRHRTLEVRERSAQLRRDLERQRQKSA